MGTVRSRLNLARIKLAEVLLKAAGLAHGEHSIEVAKRNLARGGLENRVSSDVRDAANPKLSGGYDLVTVFEAVHDLPRPVEVLRAMRALLNEEGSVIVADERVAGKFVAPGDEVKRLMYGWSVLHCVRVGMAEQPFAANGDAARPRPRSWFRGRRGSAPRERLLAFLPNGPADESGSTVLCA